MNHFAIQQNLTQHCKSNILQFFKSREKEYTFCICFYLYICFFILYMFLYMFLFCVFSVASSLWYPGKFAGFCKHTHTHTHTHTHLTLICIPRYIYTHAHRHICFPYKLRLYTEKYIGKITCVLEFVFKISQDIKWNGYS